MKKKLLLWLACGALAAVALALSGCATLDVPAPPGMFLSIGDYVPGIRTLGIIQEQTTIFAPLFLVDTNKVNQDLYKALIRKAQGLGADGITDIRFSWKPSPLTYFSLVIVSGVFDFYIEGVAIRKL